MVSHQPPEKQMNPVKILLLTEGIKQYSDLFSILRRLLSNGSLEFSLEEVADLLLVALEPFRIREDVLNTLLNCPLRPRHRTLEELTFEKASLQRDAFRRCFQQTQHRSATVWRPWTKCVVHTARLH